jgi:hypothetical protein
MKKMSLGYLMLFIIIGCSFLAYPNIGVAGVDLPWSSTYNCADWDQGSTLNCDGISKQGNYQCSPQGYYEQIIVGANNPAGSGGKGQRHWIGDATNNNSGGTFITFNTPQNEFWIRWYNRWQTGFKWTTPQTKILYLYDQGGTNTAIQLFKGGNTQVWTIHGANSDTCTMDSGYCSFQDGGWNAIYPTGISDGTWHSYELHVKRESASGAKDGIAEWWVDGVLISSYTHMNYGMAGSGYSWTGTIVGGNHEVAANGGCYYVDFDDIAVSNTGYIGPLGNGIALVRPSSPTYLH